MKARNTYFITSFAYFYKSHFFWQRSERGKDFGTQNVNIDMLEGIFGIRWFSKEILDFHEWTESYAVLIAKVDVQCVNLGGLKSMRVALFVRNKQAVSETLDPPSFLWIIGATNVKRLILIGQITRLNERYSSRNSSLVLDFFARGRRIVFHRYIIQSSIYRLTEKDIRIIDGYLFPFVNPLKSGSGWSNIPCN